MEPIIYDQFGEPVVIEHLPQTTSVLPFLLRSIAIGVALLLVFWVGLNYKAWTATENPAYGTPRVNDSTVENWAPAAAEAMQEWRRVLPGWNIPNPTVVADKDHVCNTSSESVPIACAQISNFTIYIARDQSLYDHKTIMMHEIGHLLAVPHIDGDELMDRNYQGKLDKPTPLAVVVAEYQLNHRRR